MSVTTSSNQSYQRIFYSYNSPKAVRVHIGRGVSNDVIKILKFRSISKPFVCIDPNISATRFGNFLLESISNNSIKSFVYTDIHSNTPIEDVENALYHFNNFYGDGIIGIGGGSTIDLTKALSCLISTNKSLEQVWQIKNIPNTKYPLISIPTTCGTGSEVTPFSVILDKRSKRKRSISGLNLISDEVFLDGNALLTLSKNLITFTGLDALSHALESYVSLRSDKFTRLTNIGLINGICNNISNAVDKDENSLDVLHAASLMVGTIFPYTGLTIAHSISHPLGVYFNLHHGEAVARSLIPSIKFNAMKNKYVYAQLAKEMQICNFGETDDKSVESLILYLENLFKRLKLSIHPITSPESVSGYLLDTIVNDVLKSRNIITNPVNIEKEELKDLLVSVCNYKNC